MPVMFLGDQVLFVDDDVAMDEDCCCETGAPIDCEGCKCFHVTLEGIRSTFGPCTTCENANGSYLIDKAGPFSPVPFQCLGLFCNILDSFPSDCAAGRSFPVDLGCGPGETLNITIWILAGNTFIVVVALAGATWVSKPISAAGNCTNFNFSVVSGDGQGCCALTLNSRCGTGIFGPDFAVHVSGDATCTEPPDGGPAPLVAERASLSITAQPVTFRRSVRMAAETGTLTITAPDVALVRSGHQVLLANAGSYAITGQAASLLATRHTAADAGLYTISGAPADLRHHRRLAADAGSYAITGQAATLRAARRLDAQAGTYTITAPDAQLSANLDVSVAADAGTYTITGQAATLRTTRRVATGAGQYAITGQPANLRASRRLTAQAGVYTISGQAAGLTARRRLDAQAGLYAITGQAADLQVTRQLALDAQPGTYTISGQAATLRAARRMSAGAGLYVITGNAAGLQAHRRVSANAGLYVISGPAAELTVNTGDTIQCAGRTWPRQFQLQLTGVGDATDCDGEGTAGSSGTVSGTCGELEELLYTLDFVGEVPAPLCGLFSGNYCLWTLNFADICCEPPHATNCFQSWGLHIGTENGTDFDVVVGLSAGVGDWEHRFTKGSLHLGETPLTLSVVVPYSPFPGGCTDEFSTNALCDMTVGPAQVQVTAL